MRGRYAARRLCRENEVAVTLFLIEYRGDGAGIPLLEDTVGNPRTEFPRSALLHFLQAAQDFAPVRGRFPSVRRVAGKIDANPSPC